MRTLLFSRSLIFLISRSHITPAAQLSVSGDSAYTADPVTAGADHTVIGAVTGGGAPLVQGELCAAVTGVAKLI